MTIDEYDDQTLILLSQEGNKQAFGILVKRYMQRSYYVALGLVSSHEDALDLSQEAFVRAYRAIKRFEPGRQFFTWFYQILRNLCFNFIRDRKKNVYRFSDIPENEVIEFKPHESCNLSVMFKAKALFAFFQIIKHPVFGVSQFVYLQSLNIVLSQVFQ